MEAALLSTLPNLSIGVVAVGALYFISVRFLEELRIRSDSHEAAMKEREAALRAVEREMRGELTKISEKSINVIAENNRVMARVINHLDGVGHNKH